MKVAELKEALEVRNEGRSDNKAWLRRRLHAAIVREHLWRVRWTTRRRASTIVFARLCVRRAFSGF